MLVVWYETAAPVFEENEAAFIERGERLAAQEGIYLLMTTATIRRGAAPCAQNKAVLVTPAGGVAFEYVKNRPLPGEESQLSIRGHGRSRFQDTPYGRLAVAICSDLDCPFPPLIRQASESGADTLLVPSSDWERIKYLHPHQAACHGIANGVAVVRPNRYGVSMVFDRYGRVLGAMDEFTTVDRTMVASVPTRGGPTLYSRLGDWFGWLCVLGLAAAIGFGVGRPVRARSCPSARGAQSDGLSST